MLRVTALAATLATVLAAPASAHPPDLYDSYYGQRAYGGTYGASTYVSPGYAYAPYGARSYRQPYDAAPIYSRTYDTRRHAAPRVGSYAGYSRPGYGYRHGRQQGYVNRLYHNRVVHPYGHRSFGPYSQVPETESVNFGYSGGPTYGQGSMPVINGVRLNFNPD